MTTFASMACHRAHCVVRLKTVKDEENLLMWFELKELQQDARRASNAYQRALAIYEGA